MVLVSGHGDRFVLCKRSCFGAGFDPRTILCSADADVSVPVLYQFWPQGLICIVHVRTALFLKVLVLAKVLVLYCDVIIGSVVIIRARVVQTDQSVE